MKRKLLVLLFIGILVITGCGKKSGIKSKLDVKGPRVVCSISDKYSDGLSMDLVSIVKFDKDNLISYHSTEATLKFDEKKVYDTYVEYAEGDGKKDLPEGTEYKFKKNDKDLSYTVTTIYSEEVIKNMLKDLTDEDKEEYKAVNIIKGYENSDMKCEYIEISKKDLGIK